ncbi:hypothetical protein [Microcoleus sp. FACHB-SPT15]|uniref:hypothetical protein n=1 Tax=Microcoleus sp. FACHB-SPT15 TaxID=2692830 RepID=UPI001F548BF9|nr:hypothetical protein [Microcoleus sp. FACHB-SPT15]
MRTLQSLEYKIDKTVEDDVIQPDMTSILLTDLDLALLAGYVVQPDPLEAVLEFRERVR